MKTLTRQDAAKRCERIPWVTPYERIATLTDGEEEKVLLFEDHPTPTGSQWVIDQYSRTSPLVLRATREGKRHVFLLRTGRAELELEPGIRPAGVEAVEVDGDEVRVTHAGLAGAGVGAALARGPARGVLRIEVHEEGGGAKLGRATVVTPRLSRLVIGVDDTDTEEEGATWSAVDAVCKRLESEHGIFYARHVTVQLYPRVPNRTTNCAATVVELGVEPGRIEEVKEAFLEFLGEVAYSGSTCVAFWESVDIPSDILRLGERAQREVLDPAEVDEVIERTDVEVVSLGKDECGRIGAVAALAFIDRHDHAVPK
ncbi:MAG: hypothetical protein GXO28_01725 [Methanopyri archaeon]|nr:hypothetical protein [Methanopyri archaeon]